jgi:hypothetical protein
LARGLIEKVKPVGGLRERSLDDEATNLPSGPLRHDYPDVPGLYRRFRREWLPILRNQQEGAFSLADSIDWLLRSLVPAFNRQWLAILERYATDNRLPESLPAEEEAAIRQLRNIGLARHDGPWLFTPRRSQRVWPTPAGRLLIALSVGDHRMNREGIARDVVEELSEIAHDPPAIALLEKVHRTGDISGRDQETARRLRNLHLVTHMETSLRTG